MLDINMINLLRHALRCLHHLSRCPAFFQHRCIILSVEPLLRVIPHLMESSGRRGLITACGVHLLNDILAKYNQDFSLFARHIVSFHQQLALEWVLPPKRRIRWDCIERNGGNLSFE